MQRWMLAIWIGTCPLYLSGCGQNGAPSVAQDRAAAPNAESAAESDGESTEIPADLTPQQTVVHYLEAVKAGDEEQVAALLTELARRKTAEANIAVAPPGSETASFTVGDMEIVGEDKKTAHVASMWTDVDEKGEPQTLRIVWVVRQDSAGWRIAGMVTRLSPMEPMLVLNFEDPEEVVRRNQEEIAKRQSATAQQSEVANQDGATLSDDVPDEVGQPSSRQARNPSEGELPPPR